MGNKPKRKTSKSRPGRSASQQASGRSSTPVGAVIADKPKRDINWLKIGGGFAVAALVGLLIYFVAFDVSGNPQGSVEPPDGIEFFQVVDPVHTSDPVAYPESPPVGGPHDPVWQQCQAYDEPVRNENAVHALEHGAVWVTYRPDLAPDVIAELHRLARQTEVLVSPYPGLDSAVAASVWGAQLKTDDPRDPRIEQFVRSMRNTTAPEIAASC